MILDQFYKFNYDQDKKTLLLTFDLKNEQETKIEIPIEIPNKSSKLIDEIFYRIIYELDKTKLNAFKCYLQLNDNFKRDVSLFIQKLNELYYDKLTNNLIQSYQSSLLSKNDIKSYWLKFNSKLNRATNQTQDDLQFKANASTTDQQLNAANQSDNQQIQQQPILAKMYHSLIHSDLMPKLFKIEYVFMLEINELINERDTNIRLLQEEHQSNLSEKLRPEHGYSDSYISNLAMANLQQYELERNKWQTRIDTLKMTQQRKFRKYLSKLFELNEKGDKLTQEELAYLNSDVFDDFDTATKNIRKQNQQQLLLTPSKLASRYQDMQDISSLSSKSTSLKLNYEKIEESYTIQLGAQLKSTHNLRLIRCDILDYCNHRFKSLNRTTASITNGKGVEIGSSSFYGSLVLTDIDFLQNQIEPHAIQTAMSLYSNKLCAVVLLIDPASSAANTSAVGAGAALDVSKQQPSSKNSISSRFNLICEINGCDFHFASIDQQIEDIYASKSSSEMNLGDFYITKHSNLSQCHVVFHLASHFTHQAESDQSLKHSDLSSRHPVILGIRNILKTCISHNIQTLTLPLLLTHEMSDEMTINWVMKRAELVLKCIKGFMIEFVQWGVQDSRTLQFVVPVGLMDETFLALSQLITSIFRESRTVNLN